MFWYYQNAGSIHATAFMEAIFLMLTHSKNQKTEEMEDAKQHIRNKGGRPKKEVKKDQIMSLKCTLIDRKVIEAKAKFSNLTVSEYLRTMGLTGKIDRRDKTIPSEVLQLTGTLNHLAANLNQIAKKRNGIDELDAIERVHLEVQSRDLKRLVEQIKSHLK